MSEWLEPVCGADLRSEIQPRLYMLLLSVLCTCRHGLSRASSGTKWQRAVWPNATMSIEYMTRCKPRKRKLTRECLDQLNPAMASSRSCARTKENLRHFFYGNRTPTVYGVGRVRGSAPITARAIRRVSSHIRMTWTFIDHQKPNWWHQSMAMATVHSPSPKRRIGTVEREY